MSKTKTKTRAEQIAELNDCCRGALGSGGRLVFTQGISSLPPSVLVAVLDKVRNFDTFNEDNDPHGEHDFGAFEHKGHRVFWKMDYYADWTMTTGSEDPSLPYGTVRVLTIMLASEY